MFRILPFWIQELQFVKTDSALHDYQETAMRLDDSIHRKPHYSSRRSVQLSLYRRRRTLVVGSQEVKQETVSSISRCSRSDSEVYDLTTESGNFFANGILIHNCPVDTMPAAPAVVENLKHCKAPIAYSRYGESELRKVGFAPYYIPHAVDPAIWKPGNKLKARQIGNVPPDIFFVSFVGVNDSVPSRKGIGELLMAWQLFTETHKDAMLYMHTSLTGNLGINAVGGVKIDTLIKTLGINPNTIKLADQYRYRTGIPASELVTIAQASDVLILPTTGEGFGLPLLEFQRAGCPVITTNFAAGSELCFSGWKIEGEPMWSWQDAIIMKPGITSIVEALEAAYDDRNNPDRAAKAIAGARDYDIDTVMGKYAIPVLNDIAERILSTSKVA